jgi:hypothetical protein
VAIEKIRRAFYAARARCQKVLLLHQFWNHPMVTLDGKIGWRSLDEGKFRWRFIAAKMNERPFNFSTAPSVFARVVAWTWTSGKFSSF